MIKNTLLVTMLFASTLFFVGCSDEANDTTPAPTAATKTELLTTGTWNAREMTINPGIDIGGGVILTDIYAQLDACDKDDLTKYNANGTGVYDAGAINCEPDFTPQTSPFTWVFDLTETKIIEDGESYNITELSETTLKISDVMVGDGLFGLEGIKYTFSTTYKH
jgi:hypothetical protein